MLERITLTNFQRHENLTVEFAPGLNAVKASNEMGKSTLLRAVAYALFGTKALPYSLDETVTWGKPVGSLKVELDLRLNDSPIHIVRTKSGAELTHEGGTVTGQRETAQFIADLIGADASLAGKLLIAGQNDVRGALAAGSRGAVELIEKLADFRQLDELLTLLQDHLVSGSPAALKGRLEQAEKALAETKVDPVDEAALNVEAKKAEDTAAHAAKAVKESVPTLRAAESALTSALRAASDRSERDVRHAERKAALERVVSEEPEKPATAPEPVAHLEQNVMLAEGRVAAANLYEEMQQTNAAMDEEFPKRFPGSAADLQAKLNALGTAAENADDLIYELGKSLATAQALIQTGSCTTCGQDLSNFPQVAEANRKWREQVDSCQSNIERLREEQRRSREERKELTLLLDANAPLRSHRAVKGKFATLLDETVPARLVWCAAQPIQPDDAAKALQQARQALQEAQSRNDKLDLIRRTHADWRRRLEKAQQAVQDAAPPADEPPLPDIAELTAKVEGARRVHENALSWHEKVSAISEATRRATDAAIHAWRTACAARDNAEKEAAQCRADLAKLEFNNALLAAVRQARPTVANRLWSLVLAAVSTYFSDMRGAPSVVTREGDNFLVDGHPIDSLSGSTLDALGLAVRVALLRTFLPSLSLLILDEPNAAMDEERTAQVLGFISAAGFAQTLIVSHDDMTASVADHIITLEN